MSGRWSVFVDESGAFSPGDPSVVAGLVVNGSPRAYEGGRLRQLLGEVWGPGPWPPHASHLGWPAARAVYALRAAPGDMPGGALGADARAASRALADELRCSSMADRAAEIARGAHPSHYDCHRADLLLRAHPAWRVLARARDEQDRAMGQLVAEVCRRGDGFVVAALADEDPVGPPPTERLAVRDDAYLRALEVAAERLARLASPGDVEWFVLARDIEVDGLGGVDLQGHFVAPLLERACRSTGSPARFRPGGTVFHYRERSRGGAPLQPLFVLADWLASGLRRVLRGHRGEYEPLTAAVERDLVPHEGLLWRPPGRAPAVGALPTLAAAGAPEQVVRAAFAGQPAEGAGAGWAWDQARAWVAAAERWP